MGWDERVRRARLLASECAPASTILTFYAGLAEYQRSLAIVPPGPGAFAKAMAAQDFPEALDLDAAAGAVPGFLDWLRRHAPAPLALAAAEGGTLPREAWRDLLRQRVTDGDVDSPDDAAVGFIVEAILQPFAERAAAAVREAYGTTGPLEGEATTVRPTASAEATAVRQPASAKATAVRRSFSEGGSFTRRRKADTPYGTRCPICGSGPAVGALREAGHGAKRSLVCALCFTEWDYLRVRCLACDEERFDALPIYSADTFPHVRVEACDSCRTYLKTVDLTKNGLAVPVVDDLATVSLDLWAREHGYRRLRPHLLRI